MIINVNPDWRIRTDDLQYILERKTTPKEEGGTGGWKNVGYFGGLAALFEVMIQRRIFSIDGEFPPEALDPLTQALADIRADVRNALSRVTEPRQEAAGL